MERLALLEQRVNVMQQEVREVLGVVNKDLEQFFTGVSSVLEDFHKRLDSLENILLQKANTTAGTNVEAAAREDGNGKEL